MPKCYLSDAAKQSAREELAKQIAKMPKMSAFLKLPDSENYRVRVESISAESLTFQMRWIFLRKKRQASE